MIGNNKKKILITGINGFLGSHLAKFLKNDFEILGLEYSNENLFRLKNNSFKVYIESQIEELFISNQNIFAIIHTATIYRKANESIEKLINTNILLPIKLYELAVKNKVDRFINTDTFFNSTKIDYKYLPDYTLSKKHIIEWFHILKSECKIINMKLFHIYGENDNDNKFVVQIINSLKNNVQFIDLTLGEQKRDFIYILDVVCAYKSILNNIFENNDFEEFEVGNGLSISIKDFITKAKELLKCETKLNFGYLPYRENEIMDSLANNKKLKLLGWQPKYNLENGLLNIINSL